MAPHLEAHCLPLLSASHSSPSSFSFPKTVVFLFVVTASTAALRVGLFICTTHTHMYSSTQLSFTLSFTSSTLQLIQINRQTDRIVSVSVVIVIVIDNRHCECSNRTNGVAIQRSRASAAATAAAAAVQAVQKCRTRCCRIHTRRGCRRALPLGLQVRHGNARAERWRRVADHGDNNRAQGVSCRGHHHHCDVRNRSCGTQ